MDIMRDANITEGMFPTKWSLDKGTPINRKLIRDNADKTRQRLGYV